ncbi:FAD-dependent oxidoreductase [Amaricoccus solimangrovi]|uniref:FAD-dependent oxidoreductase n=1 Tax=Amaricoccus solimangrovi TaxID=2589815 RepID=A0A501WJA8_9RHOB|nr:FAD-dependent oxidoreductase [Amaricoccus solimangrovi]TPE47121.1 FAD-dependent oxidoreductase [Amaricoccus solimangrovi]
MAENEYDVVIVGYGGAGAAAAIEAADAGGSVLVIEKFGDGGGTTRMAGGNIRSVLDAEKMIDHFHALCDGTTDRESVVAHVEGLARLPDWIERRGGLMRSDPSEKLGAPRKSGPPYPGATPGTGFPGVVGADGIGLRYRWPKNPRNGLSRGAAAWAMLAENVGSRKIDVITETAVKRLNRDGFSGRVTGLVAEQGGKEIEVRAKQGIVLSSGGFSWNPELMRQWLGVAVHSAAPPHRNTGEGIVMAQAVGAALWHMSGVVMSMGIAVPEYEATFSFHIKERGFIMVDRLGKRFCDESKLAGHSGGLLLDGRDHHAALRRRLPSYVIFDEATRLAGPIIATERGFNTDAGWSEDNSMPIEKGWITSASSIAELAAKLDLPADALAETIDSYNRGIETGADPFGRGAANAAPIEKGPFYGVAVWPTLYNTQGGPRRTARGEIVDPWGAPIPGLFGAGELGSIFNTLYPGGVNYGEAFVSGRVAGAAALGATPK